MVTSSGSTTIRSSMRPFTRTRECNSKINRFDPPYNAFYFLHGGLIGGPTRAHTHTYALPNVLFLIFCFVRALFLRSTKKAEQVYVVLFKAMVILFSSVAAKQSSKSRSSNMSMDDYHQ